jgi:large subunit ribosomal protein L6
MSRLGKQPIDLPQGVKAIIENGNVRVEGPKGKLSLKLPTGVEMNLDKNRLNAVRKTDSASDRSKHGLIRTLVSNMVRGVHTGYERKLEIVGVGFRAAVKGKTLNMTLGFSHPVDFPIPENVVIRVDGNTTVVVQSPDKALLGETAARIRSCRPPEPYQGKGIKYEGEKIRRKAGKAAATGK